MKAVESWLLKHKEKQSHFISLYDMMFEGKSASYLIFRLRLFNLQTLFRFLTHAVFFYLLFRHITVRHLSSIIFFIALKAFIIGAFWGGLETLRTEVRYLYKAKEDLKINSLIGNWIWFSALFSLGALTASFWFLYKGYGAIESGQKYVYLFNSVIFFSLSFVLPIRTYHSGIYAISRVIRPGYSMILGDIIGLLVLMLLWKRLHELAIPIAFLVTSTTSNLLTLKYTKFMYSLYNLLPKRPSLKEFFSFLKETPWIHTFIAAMANLACQIDSLLILGFYILSQEKSELLPLVFFMYLIAPLIRATSDWARLFYFDRKRIPNEHLFHFIKTYNDYINKAASYIGMLFWLIASVSSFMLISKQIGIYSLVLFPFFVLRAKISDRQIKAFSDFRYFDVLASSFVLVGGIFFVFFYPLDLVLKGLVMFAATIWVFFFLKRYHFPAYHKFNTRKFLHNIYNLLSDQKKENRPYEIYKIKLVKGINPKQTLSLMGKISELIYSESGKVCLINEKEFLVLKPQHPKSSPISSTVFALIGSGLISDVAHEVISKENPSPKVIANYLNCDYDEAQGITLTKAGLKETFFEWFEEGIIYAPERHLGPKAVPVSTEVVRSLPYLINLYLVNRKPKKEFQVDVSALYKEGSVQMVFVIPLKEGDLKENKIETWHKIVRSASI